jgi:hypothetical protein
MVVSTSLYSGLRDSKSQVFHPQTHKPLIREMVIYLPLVLLHGQSQCLQDFRDVVEFTLPPK